MEGNTFSRRSFLALGSAAALGLLASPNLAFAVEGQGSDREITPKIVGELIDGNGNVIASTKQNSSLQLFDDTQKVRLTESGSSVVDNGDGSFTVAGSVDLLLQKNSGISLFETGSAFEENGAARVTVYMTYYFKDRFGPMGYIKITQAQGEIVKQSSMATLGTRALAVVQGDYSLGFNRSEIFSGNSCTINTGWDYTRYFEPPMTVNGAECTVDTAISGMAEFILRAQLIV